MKLPDKIFANSFLLFTLIFISRLSASLSLKITKSGEDTFELKLNNINWKQKTFPYQAKCLSWIKNEAKKLNTESIKELLYVLDKTGCEKLFN